MNRSEQISAMYSIDDSRMPIKLGSAIRVPAYAYDNWDITGDPEELSLASDLEYEKEWSLGSPNQIKFLQEAAKRAGNPNFLQLLREHCTRAAIELAKQIPGKISIMDVGAGLSTIEIAKTLPDELRERTTLYLLEPSAERISQTSEKLKNLGWKENENYFLITDRDVNIPKYIKPGSIDIITAVATVHHHSYLRFDVFFDALKPGGYLVIGDLHNHLYEHPSRIYSLLEKLDWPEKAEDLAAFVKKFPKAKDKVPETSPLERAADCQTERNRSEWAKIRAEAKAKNELHKNDEVLLIDGHRPVEKYIEELIKCGFSVNDENIIKALSSNPYRILPDSAHIMITAARRPER